MGIQHSIIEHPDLIKKTDAQLKTERAYLEKHYNNIIHTIDHVRGLISTKQLVKIPAWKYMHDLLACQERWEAIVEEQNYRSIP